MIVTSAQNPQLKLVRRLQRRRAREQEGLFVVEGEDLVAAGLDTGAVAHVMLVDSERPPKLSGERVTCPVVHVEPQLLAEVSELAHPPRLIGVFELPGARPLSSLIGTGRPAPWLLLDGVGDPGNVGTVLRTTAALGGAGVILRPGTADPFGGKALRASMGACFRIPTPRLGSIDELTALQERAEHPIRVVALDAAGSVELWDAPLDEHTVIVIGGEREGVGDDLLHQADVVARIPQDAAVESMNAGVAASVALYEWRRRQGRT